MAKIKNKDIALALNISTAAVSMALNNKPGVSDETRKQVLEYVMNHSDQEVSPLLNLMNKKSIILDIHKSHGDIIIEKPFFSKLITATEMEARKDGYSLVMAHYDPSTDLEAYVSSLNQMNASGVLILATELTQEALQVYNQKLKIPFVLIDGYIDTCPTDAVSLDNQNAVFRSYQYAYSMGHRNIGYIKCSSVIPNFVHRFNGFMIGRFTLDSTAIDNPTVFELPPSMDKAQQAMAQILANLPEDFEMPTCFICDMDFVAIGAMTAFLQKGYCIPDDVSFIGFDDIDYSLMIQPSLTTIHLHESTLGREAVRLLLERIEHPDYCHKIVRLSGDFIERESVLNRNV